MKGIYDQGKRKRAVDYLLENKRNIAEASDGGQDINNCISPQGLCASLGMRKEDGCKGQGSCKQQLKNNGTREAWMHYR